MKPGENAEEVALPEARTSLQTSINIARDYISIIDNSRDVERKNLTEDLLKPSVDAATNILLNNESTIEDITVINSTLNKTLNFIQNTRWTYAEEMALLNLSAKIDEVEAFLRGVTIGNDIGNYKESDQLISGVAKQFNLFKKMEERVINADKYK